MQAYKVPVLIQAFSTKPADVPRAGHVFIYPKTDGSLYMLNSANVEKQVNTNITVALQTGEGIQLSSNATLSIRGGSNVVSTKNVGDQVVINVDAYTKQETDDAIDTALILKASVNTMSELNTLITSPQEGWAAIVGTKLYVYRGTTWVNMMPESNVTFEALTEVARLTVQPTTQVFYEITKDTEISLIRQIIIKYIAKRGGNVRSGQINILQNNALHDIQEQYHETNPIGMKISQINISGGVSLKVYIDDSMPDDCEIVIRNVFTDIIEF